MIVKADAKRIKIEAEQGVAGAQYCLGNMYALGRGIPADDVQAVAWLRKAAERVADAYGLMYASGRGVPEDDVQAVVWFRKAAKQGNADAQCELGLMYANGNGISKNDVTAYAWFNLSVARGNSPNALKEKDLLAQQMTREQIAEGQKLSLELEKHIYGN